MLRLCNNLIFFLNNLIVSFILVTDVTDGSLIRNRPIYKHADALIAARCDLLCSEHLNQKSCERNCLNYDVQKPGMCPEQSQITDFELVCLNTCSRDYECAGIQKCCSNNKCGVTCQSPTNLNNVTGIPAIPTHVTVSENRKGHLIHIRWRHDDTGSNPLIFVIQERHCFGETFIADQLSDWQLVTVSDRTEARLKRFCKMGYWYQFRVSAVNENGSRGFSESSRKFMATLNFKSPPAPVELKVVKMWRSNNSVNAELQWKEPRNDVFIVKYKVYWSRRLKGVTELDSVLVNYCTVNKDLKRIELKNLKPDSLYFLQVQAIGKFGRQRFKSDKTAIFLNTSNAGHESDSRSLTKPDITQNSVSDLHVRNIFWLDNSLRAKITWKSNNSLKGGYEVSWKELKPCRNYCKNSADFYTHQSATTQVTYLNIFNLKFDCKYRISVKGIENRKSIFLNYLTPSFEIASKKFIINSIKC